jgi:N6-adenosine-specific RNA methylase IME4
VYIAFKGKPIAPVKKLVDSVVIEPHPRKDGKIWHSAKPETVRQRIEQMYPDLRKLELFGRSLVPGWDVVGNDVSGLDIREELDGLASLLA